MQTIKTEARSLIVMKGMCKSFSGVSVLEDVDFEIFPGETHVLAGENGAGKTTLIKILAGVYTDYKGSIQIEEKSVHPASPQEANELGVAVIHQELSLVPSMTVVDNIFLGRPITRGGFVDYALQRREALRLMKRLGLELNVDACVEELPIAMQQVVEIAKVLSHDAKVIIMDEPTSALNAPEVEKLFSLIRDLKSTGCGIVYITHKMEEIQRIADRISVLRDGRLVGTAPASRLEMKELIRWMIGREISQQFPRHKPQIGENRLEIRDFSVFPEGIHARPAVARISLSVRSGEILGIGGLQGSGASELLMGLFGAYGKNVHGEMLLDGEPVSIYSPREAIDHGIALLTNDRKSTGLVLSMSIIANATLASLERFSPAGWRRPYQERVDTEKAVKYLNIRAASLDMNVNELSGGNQQKVVITKWLQTEPQLFLLDEPTRGIDVGAKREIYDLMNEWTSRGIALILISSEMPELLAMSDRIAVMHRGRLMAEFSRDQASADRILEAAMGKEFQS